MKSFMLLVISAILGCTRFYCRSGSTQEDWNRDERQCSLSAHVLNNNQTWTRDFSEQVLFESCMRDHGWTPWGSPVPQLLATPTPVAPIYQ